MIGISNEQICSPRPVADVFDLDDLVLVVNDVDEKAVIAEPVPSLALVFNGVTLLAVMGCSGCPSHARSLGRCRLARKSR